MMHFIGVNDTYSRSKKRFGKNYKYSKELNKIIYQINLKDPEREFNVTGRSRQSMISIFFSF